jgi:hypothetical protein
MTYLTCKSLNYQHLFTVPQQRELPVPCPTCGQATGVAFIKVQTAEEQSHNYEDSPRTSQLIKQKEESIRQIDSLHEEAISTVQPQHFFA